MKYGWNSLREQLLSEHAKFSLSISCYVVRGYGIVQMHQTQNSEFDERESKVIPNLVKFEMCSHSVNDIGQYRVAI